MNTPPPQKPGYWIPVCTALLFVCSPLLQAQRNAPYYNANAATLRQQLAEKTTASIQATFREPDQFNKEAREAYRSARDRIGLDVSEEISESALLDDVLWPFVQKTHAAIVAANPEGAATKVILTINPTPNAYSVGDGTLFVYCGLLAGLENEDQLAFVLCHEIAHYLLEHATNGLVREIATFHDKAFKAKVKAASKQEFNRNEQLANIYKNVLFKSRYHRRDLERQADSLAYRMFLKTNYAPGQAQRLCALFETIDEPLRDSSLNVETHFGCARHPFQAGWLEKAKGSVWADAQALNAAAEKQMQDSLRTHPDWRNRMQWLEEMAQQLLVGTSTKTVSGDPYAPIRYLSVLESVDAWFSVERYDKALFYAVQYQQVYPDCSYFKEMEALALNGLYTHLKDHSLSDVLSQSAPDNPGKYNRFLDFLNNLRLKDLLALQVCSLDAALASTTEKTEYGLMAAYFVALAQDDRSTMLAAKKEYLSKYRKGRFADVFQQAKK